MKSITGKQTEILLMLTNSLLFALMQVAIHMTGPTIPLMEQIFFRNVVTMILCFVLIRKKHISMFGDKKNQPLLLTRSVSGLLGLVTIFYAAANAKQADVTILSKTTPFLITLWAYLFLKEKISKVQIPALLIAFGGAFLVANPVFNTEYMPLLMALLCAVFSSISYTLIAYFESKVHPLTVIMHFSTFCVLVTVAFIAANPVIPDWREFWLLMLIGLFGGLGQIALTYCYMLAPAAEVSIYSYSGIAFSTILGFLFLHETISLRSVFGGLMIVGSALLVYFYNRHHSDTPPNNI